MRVSVYICVSVCVCMRVLVLCVPVFINTPGAMLSGALSLTDGPVKSKEGQSRQELI